MSYAGLQMIINPYPRTREDWSLCRSPSRAKRRHRQGHKQHMRLVELDEAFIAAGKLVISAAMESRLKANIESKIMSDMLRDGAVTETTYLCPDEGVAKFTVSTMKDMIKKYGLNEPDPFSLGVFSPITWPYDTTNRYGRKS